MIPDTIRSVLTSLRARSGLSVEDLAARIGIETWKVSGVESGDVTPGLRTIWEWATACGSSMRIEFTETTGPRPDPWPGMVVEFRDGSRCFVESVDERREDEHPADPELWHGRIVTVGGRQCGWLDLDIVEVRSAAGVVLWRRS